MSSDRDWASDESEYDSEGEDQEYVREDEEGPPKKKRRTGSKSSGKLLNVRSLIDDIADVSEDESDEDDREAEYDDDEELLDMFDEGGDEQGVGNLNHMRHVAKSLRDDHYQVKHMADLFNKRYEESAGLIGDYEMEEPDSRTPVAQEARQPSIRDPKLWLVKCIAGNERRIATHLLQKCFTLRDAGTPLSIISVVTQDHLKGFIYIEAVREAHVREAITNMQGIFQRDVKAIDLGEMVSVMTPPKKNLSVKKDDWIRCKKGLYSGDIGQVISFHESSQEVVVKLIPRLTVDDSMRDEDEPTSGRKGFRKENRPIPALFDYHKMQALYGEEVESHRGNDGEVTQKWNGMVFQDGFLLKTIPIKSLQLGVKPKYEDIKAFARTVKDIQGDDEEDDGTSERAERLFAAQARRLAAQENKVVFEKGDKVIVVEGELQGLIGEIKSVNGEVAEVVSKHKDLSSVLPVSLSQLQKHFRIGDHVKVISGKFKGETGTIHKFENNSTDIAVVLTDLGLRELQVFTTDIQIAASSDISTGTTLGDFGYKQHELVTVVPNTVGVIVSVEADSLNVLDTFGKVKQVKVQSIKERKNSNRSVSSDVDGNPIGQGDLIRVVEQGHLLGQSGSILHIYRYYAFVHNKTRTQDNGVFVVRAKACKLQGTSKKSQQTGHGRVNLPTHIGVRPTYGYGAKSRVKRNDPLLNKTVAVTSGHYKGHIGVVKAATATALTVQLQISNQKVQVPQSSVAYLEDRDRSSGGGGYFDPNATPYRGNQTPMHVSQTPMHRPNTPVHDAYTPAPFTPRGMGTPYHDNWGDIDTPAESVRTPGTSYPDNVDYPGTYADTRTPNTPGTPGTPGTGLYQTPYDAYSSRTPATPNTPGTFAANPYGVYTPEPSTAYPGTPNTPGTHYPSTPGTTGYGEVGSPMSDVPYTPTQDDSEWWCVNAEVTIKDPTSPYNGRMGYIKEVLGSMCVVGVYDQFRTTAASSQGPNSVEEIGEATVSGNDLLPVRPEKKDTVIIIRGQNRHQVGKLIGVDAPDGIVNINESEINILKLENLARAAEWTT
eukprot:TRINITY_DN5839_c1_g1_i1.p1 TRINITY_DN5839_c1_g1~~TRINITY_DN5839_c1_g1_i1.p1  ORF type:complete len:1052 (-),score=288.56 TRINITY_DN5839_c1_g1_i1:110-3265(-)